MNFIFLNKNFLILFCIDQVLGPGWVWVTEAWPGPRLGWVLGRNLWPKLGYADVDHISMIPNEWGRYIPISSWV